MTHYTVLVALDGAIQRDGLDEALTAALAPFDENTQVEPYRKYEEGGPENYWFVEAMRRSAHDLAAGTGIKPYEPDALGWSTAHSKETPDQQRAKQAEDARVAEELGERPTWPQVIAAMTARYGTPDEPMFYDEESDRAYTMSTYNPASKWDYWRVGGRWAGRFPVLAEAKGEDFLVPERSWDGPDLKHGYCDGGRKRALDLPRVRAEAASKAEADWNEYAAVTFGTQEATPWRLLVEKVDRSGNGGYSIDEARRDFRNQPRIEALHRSETFKFWSDAHDLFESMTRDEYAARQATRAVVGYALLDAAGDGGWTAPGRMGWFGVSTEDDGEYGTYATRANDFIDQLPDDAWLVIVDCHI
jgi:hypothetical protein